VAAVFLASEMPEFIVGPLAGVFVDRWDKRRTMLRMDLVRAGLLGLLIVAAGSASIPSLFHFALPRGVLLGCLYTTIALLTAASQFFGPSRLALIGDVVSDEHRERASGLAQTSGAVTDILGPALAAPLFFTVGAGWSLGLDGLSFLISFAAISLVQAPPAARSVPAGESGHVMAELLEGARLILSTGVLKTLLVAGVLITVGFGALNALAVFFLQQNLHASAALFGLLGASQGAGAVLGAIVGGPLAERFGVGRLLWTTAVLLGLLFVLFARLASVAPGLVVLFLIGVTFAVMEVAETPLFLRATPREYLGRVAALLFPMFGLSSTLSSVIAGWLAGALPRSFRLPVLQLTFGPLDTIVMGAGLLVICGGLYARTNLAATPILADSAIVAV
jgi:MFS family permease